ncbi:hypothetical protein B6D14_06860 [Gilliamella apis]|nr:hypothetical protein B6D14_06860 [Gilliamella apis]
MFDKVVFCQEQITAGALTANEGGKGCHIVTTCVVAVGVGKEGSRQPSLLERNHHIKLTSKLATKQQNARNSNNQKI